MQYDYYIIGMILLNFKFKFLNKVFHCNAVTLIYIMYGCVFVSGWVPVCATTLLCK